MPSVLSFQGIITSLALAILQSASQASYVAAAGENVAVSVYGGNNSVPNQPHPFPEITGLASNLSAYQCLRSQHPYEATER
jgi:hypothetical protein